METIRDTWQVASVTGAREVFVYGASGHGKVVTDILLAGRQTVAGYIDDGDGLAGTQVMGIPVVGDFEWLKRYTAAHKVAIALGIGGNCNRRQVAERCRDSGIELVTAIHPSAVIASSAVIGAGTVLMASSVVNPDARIGCGVIVNTAAIVEHDCVIGDYAHLSPNSAIGGAGALGATSWLGMGAVIIHGVRVGIGTIVGAGAVVVRDLPDGVVAFGVPARVQRQAHCRPASSK
jgi:sugar O-acyltransferase (sialic acid O-acetyltransferase NeuD family)